MKFKIKLTSYKYKSHNVIREQMIADAILDHVVHNARRMKLAGESLRKRQRNNITENVETE